MTEKDWIYDPKTRGSGIICCIPQTGRCPNNCADCFFQSGRSYLEPLEENLPHIPSVQMAEGRVVRMNDGNDSSNDVELVEKAAQQYKDYFFNTCVPDGIGKFSGPVVLTVNPGAMTDRDFYRIDPPSNLMFIRVRTNTWNFYCCGVARSAVDYYTELGVPVVLTFMAYYASAIPEDQLGCYEWTIRTLNPYWVIRPEYFDEIMGFLWSNPLVYSCGSATDHSCKRCGNCLREYYNTKERMRDG